MNKDLRESSLYKNKWGENEQLSLLRFIIMWLLVFALFFNGARLLVADYGWVTVDGSSMCQTLQSGDNLLTKRVENADDLERGAIIVVYVGEYEECRDVQGGYLIKRLIAKEGDRVKCENEQVYILYAGEEEWRRVDEPYAYYGNPSDVYDFKEYTVGEGEIFFLGDNREYSRDSRYYEWKEGKCHLKDRLYRSEDVVGYVPDWALEKSTLFEKFFSIQDFLNKVRERIIGNVK